ncbi:c-type cytochrome [Ottowia caeni]|uniref:c-type cytochrome n=1 Tax=Ottowia caeni TaxID=2870339 RepID=UPI003D72837E|nr:c-type cytochrome [Ottowia caeni]
MKRALIVLATLAAVSAPVMANEALAKSKNCMACHSVDKKLVGPSYKDVAAKYAKDAGAADALAAKIIKGSSGVWGAIPMPPNATLSPADAKTLATWVLSIK